MSSSTGPAPRHRTPHDPGPRTSTTPRGPVSSSQGPAPRVRVPHQDGRVLVRRTVYHNAPGHIQQGTIRYQVPRNYHSVVLKRHIYRRWIMHPVYVTYRSGYYYSDNYPWYYHNGYRHRYDPVDMCEYELVDGNDYKVVSKTGLLACNAAYDKCAQDRDVLNREIGMERYFCAEAVDDDLTPADQSEYTPVPGEMDDAKKATIEAYLAGMSTKDIWKDGWYNHVGKCSIVKLRGNEHGCRWLVQVGETVFPDPDGAVCSEPDRAALIGCEEKDEKRNAGCILEKAIREGYCH